MMDYFLVIIFMWITGKKSSVFRIVMASFAGAGFACFMFLFCRRIYTRLYVNVVGVIVIILILYSGKMRLTIMKIIRLSIVWYFNAFAMGGVFGYLITQEVTFIRIMRISLALLLIVYIFAGKNRLVKMRSSNENIYKVTLVRGDKRLEGYGYYDSGCNVYEPVSGKEVIVTSFDTIYGLLSGGECHYIKIFPELPEEWDGKTHVRSVFYSTVDKEKGALPAVKVDKIIIENERRKKSYGGCYAAVCKYEFTKEKEYDYLLHCNMKIGG